jgi:hypothetical protein
MAERNDLSGDVDPIARCGWALFSCDSGEVPRVLSDVIGTLALSGWILQALIAGGDSSKISQRNNSRGDILALSTVARIVDFMGKRSKFENDMCRLMWLENSPAEIDDCTYCRNLIGVTHAFPAMYSKQTSYWRIMRSSKRVVGHNEKENLHCILLLLDFWKSYRSAKVMLSFMQGFVNDKMAASIPGYSKFLFSIR